MSESPMPRLPITILGAGIGGLTLGQCLRRKGIPSVLYEKASSSAPRHSYGITLYHSSYESLSSVLGLDQQAFKQQVAVDSLYHNGTGKPFPHSTAISSTSDEDSTSCRANRAKLEALLRSDMNIKWDHSVSGISLDSDNDTISLTFTNKPPLSPPSITIDTLGVHSPVRKTLLPHSPPTVLSYVVFSGKRRIPTAEFHSTFAPSLANANCLVCHVRTPTEQVRLEISVNDHLPADEVSISYIYSRPARTSGNDPLHRPNRPNDSATSTPEELYTELAVLGNSLPEPFSTIFHVPSIRNDRVLHWLMRTTSPTTPPLSSQSRSIISIGDAAHATPILGGAGANSVIRDAVELADAIATGDDDEVHAWYVGSVERWRREGEESERRIAEMHGVEIGGRSDESSTARSGTTHSLSNL